MFKLSHLSPKNAVSVFIRLGFAHKKANDVDHAPYHASWRDIPTSIQSSIVPGPSPLTLSDFAPGSSDSDSQTTKSLSDSQTTKSPSPGMTTTFSFPCYHHSLSSFSSPRVTGSVTGYHCKWNFPAKNCFSFRLYPYSLPHDGEPVSS